MDAKRIQLKLYAADHAERLDLRGLVPVFHDWVKHHRIEDEVLVNVTDYTHVPDGPGVALIGHGAHYFLDLGEARPGLLFSRKRAIEGDLAHRLEDTFRRTLAACDLLEKDERADVSFETKELLLRIQDRLLAPNDDATLEAIEPALRALLERLYPGETPASERVSAEAREPFALRVKLATNPAVSALLERL